MAPTTGHGSMLKDAFVYIVYVCVCVGGGGGA